MLKLAIFVHFCLSPALAYLTQSQARMYLVHLIFAARDEEVLLPVNEVGVTALHLAAYT